MLIALAYKQIDLFSDHISYQTFSKTINNHLIGVSDKITLAFFIAFVFTVRLRNKHSTAPSDIRHINICALTPIFRLYTDRQVALGHD